MAPPDRVRQLAAHLGAEPTPSPASAADCSGEGSDGGASAGNGGEKGPTGDTSSDASVMPAAMMQRMNAICLLGCCKPRQTEKERIQSGTLDFTIV